MLKSSTERRDSVTLFTSFLICQSPKTRKTSRQKSGYSWSNKGEQANNGWLGSIPNIAQKGLACTAAINLAFFIFAKIILPISISRKDDKLPSRLSKSEGTISHVCTIVLSIKLGWTSLLLSEISMLSNPRHSDIDAALRFRIFVWFPSR